jgi:hypothetical protein
MSSNNLTIDLKKAVDKHGSIYYIGRLRAPAMIDCSEGVAFLIFTSSDGEEQMQIALMDKKSHDDQDK